MDIFRKRDRHPGGRTCSDLTVLGAALIGTLLVMAKPANWKQIAEDVKAYEQGKK